MSNHNARQRIPTIRTAAEQHLYEAERLADAAGTDVIEVPDPRPGARPASTIAIWNAISWHRQQAEMLTTAAESPSAPLDVEAPRPVSVDTWSPAQWSPESPVDTERTLVEDIMAALAGMSGVRCFSWYGEGAGGLGPTGHATISAETDDDVLRIGRALGLTGEPRLVHGSGPARHESWLRFSTADDRITVYGPHRRDGGES